MKMIAWSFCVLAVMAPTASEPALAQYQMVSPMLYHGPEISFRDHVNAQNSASGAPKRNGASEAAPTAKLIYHVDLARRRNNLAQFVEKVRAVDPQGATNLANEFAQGDFIARLQTELRRFGLTVDNVADAYATYWISAYQATKGDSSTPNKTIIDAVRTQSSRALSSAPEFAQASDAAKQEMAEALWIQAALLDTAVSGAKDKPDDLRLVGKAASQGARSMGLDLSTLSLTDKGFVQKAP